MNEQSLESAPFPEGLLMVVSDDGVLCYHKREKLKSPLPPVYLQRDPRWASKHYARDCSLTFGNAGCLTVCIASLAAWAGYDDGVPIVEDVASTSIASGAYSKCLLTHPEAVTEAYPKMGWHEEPVFSSRLYGKKESSRIDWRSRPTDLVLLQELLSRFPVVLEVDYNPKNDTFDQHFVLAIEYKADPNGSGVNDDLLVMDPLSGLTSVLTYFNPDWLDVWMSHNKVSKVARTITGARVWEIV